MIQTETKIQTIDKDLLQKRFRCACKTYDKHAKVQKKMAEVLVDMAKNYVSTSQNRMMELGCGTGLLTKKIVGCFSSEEYTANDLVPEVETNVSNIINLSGVSKFKFIQGDAEKIYTDQKQDVIWSGATIQWMEDLDHFFYRMSAALNENGFLVLSSFDVDNFKEVKSIAGKGIDYKTMQEVEIYAIKYFKALEIKSWHQKLWFNHPNDILRHMRFTGVNAVSPTKWGKADLENFNLNYESFKTAEGYPLTYHPTVLVLQKR